MLYIKPIEIWLFIVARVCISMIMFCLQDKRIQLNCGVVKDNFFKAKILAEIFMISYRSLRCYLASNHFTVMAESCNNEWNERFSTYVRKCCCEFIIISKCPELFFTRLLIAFILQSNSYQLARLLTVNRLNWREVKLIPFNCQLTRRKLCDMAELKFKTTWTNWISSPKPIGDCTKHLNDIC